MHITVDGKDVEVVVHDIGGPVPPGYGDVLRGGSLPPPPPAAPSPRPVAGVAIVGGLDAGRRALLAPGRAVVGRAATSDLTPLAPSVSRQHAELVVDAKGSVRIADLGSRNGTWLDDGCMPPGTTAPLDRARLGAVEVAVVPADHGDAPVAGAGARRTPAGTVPFNRPPRVAGPPPPQPVLVPDPPIPPNPPGALGVVTVLAPIAMAGVLVIAMGNPVFALLALLSPVVAVGNHVEGKRRARRGRRRDAAARTADLRRAAAELAAAVDAEVRRRHTEAPDLAEVIRRAAQPSTHLWERRPGHDDLLRLRVGTGAVPWDPPLDGDRHPRPPDLAEVVAAASTLPRCPATVDLADGGVVGVVGPRPAALAIARSLLCQVAVHHGPADVPIAVVVAEGAVGDWEWAKWLPHVDDGTGGRWLAAGRQQADDVAAAFGSTGRPSSLVVVDGDDLLVGRRAPVRSLLAGPASGIVVAASDDRLPAACTAVVAVDDEGTAELRLPRLGRRLPDLLADGAASDTAERCARAVARFDDPELDVAGAGLPDEVRLLPLLALDGDLTDAVHRRWEAAGADPRPVAPLGLAADGVLEVDLVADGPHALVAGTTGAGKSELLRTLVAGLAAAADPDHLTFVLVDFKGGSAFDACARLPHVVGLVTDLDDALAERALRSLEAELRHRERVLRAAGADDLAGYRRGRHDEPLPRLVVVVDEFATLRAELPDFVEALVGIAQRGRSLGVHLVLATQRPAGAVSDTIRANANLRIALRVQDVADSTDVVDVPDAAHLPRRRPGRALVRLGPGEVVAVQTALATAAAGPRRRRAYELRPFTFGPGWVTASERTRRDGASDLDRLVDACGSAWDVIGRPAPRRPWLEPLPGALDRDAIGVGEVALADDPDGQCQVPLRWRPDDGNLAVYGVGGSGTTTSLLAAALALADRHDPRSLHLYAVDHGAAELAVLGDLPHTGAVIGAGEGERQVRLVRRLRHELDRRRSTGATSPAVVLLVDGIGSFLAQFDDVAGLEVLDAFGRVFADGVEVGIHVAVAADRPGALPSALSAVVRQRWVHQLADPLDAGAVGVAGRLPALPPGRFVDVVTGLVAQVAQPADGWSSAVDACIARWSGVAPTAAPVGALPAVISLAQLGAAPSVDGRPWRLPIGVADDDLGVAELVLWDGDHVLLAGPPRSGRSTALAALGVLAAAAGAQVVTIDGRRSRRGVHLDVDPSTDHPTVVLVDDAELVDDDSGVLERLVDGGGAVHVVAAGRGDALRGLYSHWTRAVRRSRLGVLLRPHLDLDGELLAAPLPRRVTVPMVAGRGFLVADGTARLVQLARA